MAVEFSLTPLGRLVCREATGGSGIALEASLERALLAALEESTAQGLLLLATRELPAGLPPAIDFFRHFARDYLTRLCQTPRGESSKPGDSAKLNEPVAPPSLEELTLMTFRAPPLTGAEYLSGETLQTWWKDLDELARAEGNRHAGGIDAWLRERNPQWRFVGRVTLHLAENKRTPETPFAFLATYTSRLSSQGRAQHEPLGNALNNYGHAREKQTLLALLQPIAQASQRSELIRELVASNEIYQPLAWSPREAYRFLQDIPTLESAGLIVRVPDWWKPKSHPRPQVSVNVGGHSGTHLDAEALLSFSVEVSLGGETLTERELQELLQSSGGLVKFKDEWVEVDREKLSEALAHWQLVEQQTRQEGISFLEGMRLLAGAPLESDTAAIVPEAQREWIGVTATGQLKEMLERMRSPETLTADEPPGLRAELRPYQRVGAAWLRFLCRLGLGACLADDMGLGKTVQVIALLLWRRGEPKADAGTSLLVVPASLMANWKSELEKFAPDLKYAVIHPAEGNQAATSAEELRGVTLAITSYGMLTRNAWLVKQAWDVLILDEAQAIKNAGTRQSRIVKTLQSRGRVALTGTPVENRLSDLWSLFDFLNPGLLGSAKSFSSLVKRIEADPNRSYEPLRLLVQPYLLRRLKTDKRVIADLPDKTEVRAYCGLTKEQAALYESSVRELAKRLKEVEGIKRRGLVLSQLMRLKQICNHPAQATGRGTFEPSQSGKFSRLGEICEELAARQERVLIFTQFREITEPLAEFLGKIFGRPGLVLHGGTPVKRRRDLVHDFQRDDGPPFFVLSIKAGGTGLNLTAASQVIHFDRWWNPAVENQATDRAFRIGQKKNVLVQKFVCRGTVEERIDAMIAEKSGLAENIVEGGEVLLTEMSDKQLLDLVSLDIHKALEQ